MISMNFSRRGLDELTAVVDAGRLDAVLVKDLSRLGRHRTQTALFIDYLRERGVRVISVTEGLDTVSDKDDLVISVRGLMNDYYARDIGKKIRTGYRQKQRDGIVSLLPLAIHQHGQAPSRGSGNRSDDLFSVLTRLWTKRDCPQTQRVGTKDTGAASGGAMLARGAGYA